MASVATNMVSLSLFNQGRKNLIEFTKGVERLTSGNRIVDGEDDPSGLSISALLSSEIRGLNTAIHNTQDGINMLRHADGALNEAHDILFRMKDNATRMANEATMNYIETDNANYILPSDVRDLFKEMQELADELKRSLAGVPKAPPANPIRPAVTFNGKVMFNGDFEEEENQNLQIGPDTGTEFLNQVVIPSMAALVDNGVSTDNYPDFPKLGKELPGDLTQEGFTNYAKAVMTEISRDIELVSDARAIIGTKMAVLEKTVDDLTAQAINNSGMRSNITDADMAQAVADFAKVQILNQTTETFAGQVNLEAILVAPLLQAILTGLPPSENAFAPPMQEAA